MYKVLIVDDEALVSVMIKSLVQWEDIDVSIEYEAENGKQALEIIRTEGDVDIVITDMNMPVMDGLELIKEIGTMKEPLPVIVLSAYEDYRLVRDAFKLGIRDYLLKTEIDSDNLSALVLQVIQRLKSEVVNTRSSHLGKKTVNEAALLKEQYIKKMLSQEYEGCKESEMEVYGIRLSGPRLLVCSLWIDNYQVVEERYIKSSLQAFVNSVLNTVGQIIGRIGLGEFISISPQEYVMILSQDRGPNSWDKAVTILEDIRTNLHRYVNVTVTIGVSDYGSTRDIHILYSQAQNNVKLRFIYGTNRIITIKDTKKLSDIEEITSIENAGSLIDAIKKNNESVGMTELEKLLNEKRLLSEASIDNSMIYYAELVFLLINTLNDLGEEVADVFGKDIDFYNQITKFETCQEIHIWLKNLVRWIFEYRKNKEGMGVSFSISKALAFIHKNYRDENITIQMVSNYVGLSENYFSVLFKKEVGTSFKNHLIKLRVNKAIEIMESTNLKIYEVCDYIGYQNVEHFSRIFKKVTGSSPNKYRNKNL